METKTEQCSSGIPKIGDLAPDFTAMTTHGELTFSKQNTKGRLGLSSPLL